MKRFPTIALFASLASACVIPLQGQAEVEFAELIGKTQDRIATTLAEYEAFLKQQQNEKLELVSAINKIENNLVQLRQKEIIARRAATESELDLTDLQSRINALDTQTNYTHGVLSEYLTNFESRIHISEDQYYATPLRELRESLSSLGDNSADRIPALFEALELGLKRQESLVGGKRFEGRAITPNGGVLEGTIAIVGPAAYFTSKSDATAGPLRFNSGTIEPGMTPIDPLPAQRLQELVDNGTGLLPLDSSLGNALVLKNAKGTLPEHIAKGGWVGYAILTLGGLALLVALFKLIELRGLRIHEPEDIHALAHHATTKSREEAQSQLSSLKGPIAKMLSIGIDFSKTNVDTQLDAMESVILRYRPQLERFLPVLATTAAVAPLMGLLGTVVGMIKTFTLIEVFGTGDAKSLSSGISEALVTTELGLIVAIPALILHGIFARIMRSRLGAMEQIAADFSRLVFADRNGGDK